MIYGIFSGTYSDRHIVGYFDNLEEAEKYCAFKGGKECEYEIEEVKDLHNDVDLSKVEVMYCYNVCFTYTEIQGDEKGKLERIDSDYDVYTSKELKYNHVDYNCYKTYYMPHANSFVKEIKTYSVGFEINLKQKNQQLAEKIATDYFYELLGYGNGLLDTEYIELMNMRFEKQKEED